MNAPRLVLLILGLANLVGCSCLGPISARRITRAMSTIPQDGSMTLAEQLKQASSEITPMDEYGIGRDVAATLIQRYGVLEKEVLVSYVNTIVQTIVLVSERPEVYGGYHALILDADHVNCYATPGGHILVTRGLIQAAMDEDMLAAALAHSVSDIVLGHGAASIRTARILKMSQLLAEARVNRTAPGPGARLAESLADSLSDEASSSAARTEALRQSMAADMMALDLMQQVGYCRESMIGLLLTLKVSVAGDGARHRLIDERVRAVRGRIGSTPGPGCRDGDYEVRRVRFMEAVKGL